MNEELTPAEHAALRARLLTGSKRIRPVGKHRAAWVSGSVAVALVAMIAGGVTVGATLSAPPITGVVTPTPIPERTPSVIPSSAPTVRPTPTTTPGIEAREAIRPFGGECVGVLEADVIREVLGSDPRPPREGISFDLFSTSGSTARAGGLACSWSTSSDGPGSLVAISIFPASVVTADVFAKWSELGSEGLGYLYEKHRQFGDLVIGATVNPLGMAGIEPTDEELAAVERRVDRLIDEVARKSQGQRAEPARAGDSWWRLRTCADVEGALQSEISEPLTAGFPGDHIPLGMVWDTLAAAKVLDWCSWYGEASGSPVLVEIYPLPGGGRPADAEIAASGGSPANVAGADESWITEDPQQAGSFDVLAVAGPNRLSMRFSGAESAEAAESLAAAFLVELNSSVGG